LNRKVVIAINTAWNLVNFRAGLIRALVASGYEVVAVAPPDEYAGRLDALGCRYSPLPMDNKGTHPGRDLLLLWRFFCLLRNERPAVFLGYTVKPNVYGSLAAHALNIPVINNIAGLGVVFAKDNWLARLVRGLYRLALARSARVFFQNPDDLEQLVTSRVVRREVAGRVPGSGVNLERFEITALPCVGEEVRFLLVARMLWDKGVGEYVEAARIVKRRFANADFCLLGFLDVQNPTAISREQMSIWTAEGFVRYLGVSDDVRKEIAEADCVVLPSFYREGIPRSLLEAAAMGRPIITTDAVGCKEVVEDGVTGFLCQRQNAESLAEAMLKIIELSPATRQEMGRRGRLKVEGEFDEKTVIGRYLETVSAILGGVRS